MPDTPDHLHRLIHAMSRAEKRYFKLHTSRHLVGGHSNLQALFDAIAAMPEYDAGVLKECFAGQAFMRRFAITKRRLYEAVLHSLDAFHAESSVDDKLRRMLHQVELLYGKALYADAAKLLRTARTLARDQDRQALLLQAAEWERRVMERSNYADVTDGQLEKRAGYVAGLVTEWMEADRLWAAKSDSFRLLFRSGQASGPTEMEQLDQLERHPLLAPDARPHSAYARFLHHHVRSALAFARNDLPACEKQLGACAEVLRKDGERLYDNQALLLGVMGNLSHVQMRLGRHQEALDGFRVFRRLPLLMKQAPNRDLEMKLFVMGSSLELAVLAVKGDFHAAVQTLPALEEGLGRHGGRISTLRRAELMLQAAYACFGAGGHGQVLRWCNRLLGEKGIGAHAEVHALGRLLNLMVLIELGRTEHLAYVVRNMRRSLDRHGRTSALEPLLLDHAEALAKGIGPKARSSRWGTFQASLAERAKDGPTGALLDRVDLLAWAQGKVEDRAFGDVVKDRWHARMGGNGTRPKQAA